MNHKEPAYPLNELDDYSGAVCAQHFGMPIRMHIAIEAMKGMLANANMDYAPMVPVHRRAVVKEAWLIADEMLQYGNESEPKL
jgi:hypothetical protein